MSLWTLFINLWVYESTTFAYYSRDILVGTYIFSPLLAPWVFANPVLDSAWKWEWLNLELYLPKRTFPKETRLIGSRWWDNGQKRISKCSLRVMNMNSLERWKRLYLICKKKRTSSEILSGTFSYPLLRNRPELPNGRCSWSFSSIWCPFVWEFPSCKPESIIGGNLISWLQKIILNYFAVFR